jgi:hypothetical protein
VPDYCHDFLAVLQISLPSGAPGSEIPGELLGQCRNAGRRNTLKPGLAVVIRLAGPGTLADLHIAAMREALHIGLARECNGRGLRSRGAGGGCGRCWITGLLLRRRIAGLLLGRRIAGLLLGRRIARLLCGVPGLLLRIGLLARLRRIARLLLVLPGRSGRGLLVLLAGGDPARGEHADHGGPKHNHSHVSHTSPG